MSAREPHEIEQNAIDIVRVSVNRNGGLFREFSGRDTGLDALIELYDDHGRITGNFFFVQIKGSESQHRPHRSGESVSCQVRHTTLKYRMQATIPIVLIAVDTQNECFYFEDLLKIDDINESAIRPTARLPASNICAKEKPSFSEWLINLSQDYFKNRKATYEENSL